MGNRPVDPPPLFLVARIAQPELLAIWHHAVASQARLQRESTFRHRSMSSQANIARFSQRLSGQNPCKRRVFASLVIIDEGQITHLICARLEYDLYDFDFFRV